MDSKSTFTFGEDDLAVLILALRHHVRQLKEEGEKEEIEIAERLFERLEARA